MRARTRVCVLAGLALLAGFAAARNVPDQLPSATALAADATRHGGALEQMVSCHAAINGADPVH